jgi:hypothetical protein
MLRGFAILNDEVISVNNTINATYEKWKESQVKSGATILELERAGNPWGSPNALKFVDGDVVEKTAEDLFDEQRTAIEDSLWQACKAYEASQIYPETLAELDKSERAVESGQATEEDLPLAAALGDWRQALWGLPTDAADVNGSYFARKNSLSVDTIPSGDFLVFGFVEVGFVDIRAERKAFLAV